jgi:hypothetical protein
MTITFGFQLGERVKIPEISSNAVIEGARVIGAGDYNAASIVNEYLVSYWMSGKRESNWVPQSEIQKI